MSEAAPKRPRHALDHAEVTRLLLFASNAHLLGRYWLFHVGAANLALGLAFHVAGTARR